MKNLILFALVALLLTSPAAAAEVTLSAPEVEGVKGLKTFMAGFYEPVEAKVTPKAPLYKLPLDLAGVTNATAIRPMLQASEGLEDHLKATGIAAGPTQPYDDVAKFYEAMKTAGTPIFVTSDSLLHLYHIQFDETLKHIEEKEFFNDALALSLALLADSRKLQARLDGEDKEAARRCVAFFSVPVQLLSADTLSGAVRDALAEVTAWPDAPRWDKLQSFMGTQSALIDELRRRNLLAEHAFPAKAPPTTASRPPSSPTSTPTPTP